MADLLDKLGKAKADGKKVEPKVVAKTDTADDSPLPVEPVSSDLIGVAKADAEPVAGDSPAAEDPYKDWSKDQLVKVLQETRQEAAKRRVEVKEVEQRLQGEYESKIKAVEDKFAPLLDKAEKFDKKTAEEADKKRTLEEKLANREQMLTQKEDEVRTIREEYSAAKKEFQTRESQLKANLEAHESFYKEQLDKEKAEIPKKFQSLVDTIIKGANDTKQALELIRDAKKENLFGEKKVFVNHSVPNKDTGARTDSAKAQQDRRDGMKSSDKIRAGLKDALPKLAAEKKFGL